MGEVPPQRTPSTFLSHAVEGAPSRAGAASTAMGEPPLLGDALVRPPAIREVDELSWDPVSKWGLQNWIAELEFVGCCFMVWYVWYARQMRVLWAALHKFSCSNFFERACWRSIRGEAPLSLSQHNSQSADCWLQNFLVTSASLGHLFLVSSGARLRLCSAA